MKRLARLVCLLPALAHGADGSTIDLASLPDVPGLFERVLGSSGLGTAGVPVAAGADCDGDEHGDYAFASMRAAPFARTDAGEAYLVFGTGLIDGTLDTALPDARILHVAGGGRSEAAGGALAMADVTGDGIGDLVVARQNHRPDAERIGAGAVSIVVGGAALRSYAATLATLDLAAPPASVVVTTVVGREPLGRFGMWVRTGDVTGDGIDDVVVGADQEGDAHAGAAYVVRGGPHLAAGGSVEVGALAGRIARIVPGAGAEELHFGATCQIADLDGNGRGEVLIAGALARVGGSMVAEGAPTGSAHSEGGSQDGTVFIVWDDAFGGDWPADFEITIGAGPGSASIVDGGAANGVFGEELLGGVDYDDDGGADVFVGDLFGERADGTRAGSGHVIYDAAGLKGLTFDLDAPPPSVRTTTFLGVEQIALTTDAAMQGDFDGDAVADLAFSAPRMSPLGRDGAGVLYVFFGKPGGWPALVDLAADAAPLEILGVHGTTPASRGDLLGYSGAAGDVDGDGLVDLLANEMLGDGSAAVDVGNLLLIGGRLLAGYPCPSTPLAGCDDADGGALRLRDAGGGRRDRLRWKWTGPAASGLAEALDPERLAGRGSFALCLYDAAGPQHARAIPFGTGWRGTRFRAAPDAAGGVTRLDARLGRRRTSVAVRGRGDALAPPALPLAAPLTVQLVDGRRCWQTVFSEIRRNGPGALRASVR